MIAASVTPSTACIILLNEGSGAMQRVRQFLDDEACNTVWKLNHLRNKWLRHDPQLGSEADQRGNFAQLREAHAFFGAPSMPHDTFTYNALYEAMLEQMCVLAQSLHMALLLGNTAGA